MAEITVEVRPKSTVRGDLVGGQITERLADRIHDVGGSIAEIANKLREDLGAKLTNTQDAWSLDTVELAFSLELEAEAGVVVSKGSISAGFEVTLGWSRTG